MIEPCNITFFVAPIVRAWCRGSRCLHRTRYAYTTLLYIAYTILHTTVTHHDRCLSCVMLKCYASEQRIG